MLDALPPASHLIADRGYDSTWFRQELAGKGIEPCIPSSRSRKIPNSYDKTLYRKRHKVENLFAKLKDWRRIATRYDRCAHTFFSAICIAAAVAMRDLFWLSDEAWAALEPHLPKNQPGARRVDDRRVISGILHILKTGGRWRDVPPEYGPAKTIYNRYARWARRGVWQRIFTKVAAAGPIPDELMLDSSHVKAHRSASGGKGGMDAGGRRLARRQNNENPLSGRSLRPHRHRRADARHRLPPAYPQGTKLFGRGDSKVSFGQSHVLVVWTDIIFPNGSTLQIGATAGTDAQGYGGFNDKVNRHYLRKFGSAVLLAVIGTGIDMALPKSSTLATQNTASDAARRNFTETFGLVAEQTITKTSTFSRHCESGPATKFNVLVDQDVVFPEAQRM